MSTRLVQKKKFGTAPVFFTAICTILGAVMFLRFGYAVGHLGIAKAWLLVLLGHAVTIPTAMAISEIATNQKVEGGGEYYIISRSFGLTIGGAIGLALYMSQAISVAFYVIAFAQAFEPLQAWIEAEYGLVLLDLRLISLPALAILMLIVMTKGASLGIKMLYWVAVLLFISLIFFFLGSTEYNIPLDIYTINLTVDEPKSFFYIFAVCFPAFTGMTAGVGLSGELRNPSRSIPLGTLSATLVGMAIYILIIMKLGTSATPEELDVNQLVMSKVSIWAPIIPIGLGAATISSAIGSFLIAPRTLQAITADKILPMPNANTWLSKLTAKGEPQNATLLTGILSFFFVAIGDVNFVAQIITMFFMLTYGAICTISFLEHFTSDPAYRPSFKSKWFLSLLGAIICLYLMFRISSEYALAALVIMVLTYYGINHYQSKKQGLSAIFQGVIFQLSRQLQVFLQKAKENSEEDHWRPSVICISDDSFERFAAFDMLRWMAHKYGFGTYIHRIEGYLSRETFRKSEESMTRLIKIAESTASNIFLDTLVSPSVTSAIAQAIQLPGLAGKDNNMILFEFSKNNSANLHNIVDNLQLVKAANFDVCILGSSEKHFGYKREIHIWLTNNDLENANLMILLSFIIIGHPEWRNARISVMAVLPEATLEEQRKQLLGLIKSGRLPISPNNVEVLPRRESVDTRTMVNEKSVEADLTIIGFRSEAIKHNHEQIFLGYDRIGDVLFVNTNVEKSIE